MYREALDDPLETKVVVIFFSNFYWLFTSMCYLFSLVILLRCEEELLCSGVH